jgi:hypothetical protein
VPLRPQERRCPQQVRLPYHARQGARRQGGVCSLEVATNGEVRFAECRRDHSESAASFRCLVAASIGQCWRSNTQRPCGEHFRCLKPPEKAWPVWRICANCRSGAEDLAWRASGLCPHLPAVTYPSNEATLRPL